MHAGGAAILALIEHDLAPLLLGADGGRIDALWRDMWQRTLYVGRGGMPPSIAALDIALWERVAAMRELLGAALMVDANMRWTVAQAIAAARALAPFEVYWLEEPIAPDDYAGHRRVAAEGSVPVAAGESLRSVNEFAT